MVHDEKKKKKTMAMEMEKKGSVKHVEGGGGGVF